jgi:hypothetical protein
MSICLKHAHIKGVIFVLYKYNNMYSTCVCMCMDITCIFQSTFSSTLYSTKCTALQAERSWVRFPLGSIFHLLNPADRTMALQSIQLLTKLSTRVHKRWPERKADTHTTFMFRLSINSSRLNLLEP